MNIMRGYIEELECGTHLGEQMILFSSLFLLFLLKLNLTANRANLHSYKAKFMYISVQTHLVN